MKPVLWLISETWKHQLITCLNHNVPMYCCRFHATFMTLMRVALYHLRPLVSLKRTALLLTYLITHWTLTAYIALKLTWCKNFYYYNKTIAMYVCVCALYILRGFGRLCLYVVYIIYIHQCVYVWACWCLWMCMHTLVSIDCIVYILMYSNEFTLYEMEYVYFDFRSFVT